MKKSLKILISLILSSVTVFSCGVFSFASDDTYFDCFVSKQDVLVSTESSTTVTISFADFRVADSDVNLVVNSQNDKVAVGEISSVWYATETTMNRDITISGVNVGKTVIEIGAQYKGDFIRCANVVVEVCPSKIIDIKTDLEKIETSKGKYTDIKLLYSGDIDKLVKNATHITLEYSFLDVTVATIVSVSKLQYNAVDGYYQEIRVEALKNGETSIDFKLHLDDRTLGECSINVSVVKSQSIFVKIFNYIFAPLKYLFDLIFSFV